MLRGMKDLEGYAIRATDGDIVMSKTSISMMTPGLFAT